jgi:hypothetical protein
VVKNSSADERKHGDFIGEPEVLDILIQLFIDIIAFLVLPQRFLPQRRRDAEHAKEI